MHILNALHSVRSRFHNLGLHTKLITIFMLSVFLPLFIAIYLFAAYIVHTSSDVTRASIGTAYEQAYSVLSNQMNSIKRSASLLLNDDKIIKYFRKPVNGFDISQQLAIKDSMSNDISYIENAQNIMRLEIFVDDEYVYMQDNYHYFSIESLSKTPWYADLNKTRVRSVWLSSEDNAENPSFIIGGNPGDTLSYAIKAVNYDNYNETLSVIKLDFLKSNIEGILQKSLVVNGSASYLVSTRGAMIASASKGIGTDLKDMQAPVKQSSSLKTAWLNLKSGNKPYYVGMRAFDKSDWFLVTVVPLSSIGTGSINSIQAFFFISMVVGIGALMFITTLMFSNSITKRITMVVNGMKNIKYGELKTIKDSKRRDEIGSLIDEYNYMTGEMKQLIESKYLSGINLKSAELKALQAQINPHFLYNTLELINSYSYLREPEIVNKLIGSLSSFYRLSLNHGEDIYQIWQELQLVEAYFNIQKIRYPDSLTLKIDVPSTLLQYNIPKITFQPLIENCVIHGILCKKGKAGTITITGLEMDGAFRISIHDDGAGMDREMLDKLNTASLTENKPGSHYGIQNINYRIQLYYGNQYRLEFQSEPGCGTTVILLLPMK